MGEDEKMCYSKLHKSSRHDISHQAKMGTDPHWKPSQSQDISKLSLHGTKLHKSGSKTPLPIKQTSKWNPVSIETKIPMNCQNIMSANSATSPSTYKFPSL